MGRLDGKVTLITGGALGIGAATSLMMAREGAKIAVTDIKPEDGEAVVRQIEAAGGVARYWNLDVCDEAAVEGVFGEVAEAFGKLTTVVANAGIAGTSQPTDEIPLDDWEKVMAVNVRGVFLCTKHAIPHFRQAGGGSIINLSSVYGIVGAPDLPPYHASKGAVRMMSKTDALLYATENIRVNSVHPGYIWTPLVEEFGLSVGVAPDDFKADLGSRHPVGHVGEPDDVAAGIVYLASDEAKFVTGAELVIDGGYIAR